MAVVPRKSENRDAGDKPESLSKGENPRSVYFLSEGPDGKHFHFSSFTVLFFCVVLHVHHPLKMEKPLLAYQPFKNRT